MPRRRVTFAVALAVACGALAWRWLDRPWTLRVDDVPASWDQGRWQR